MRVVEIKHTIIVDRKFDFLYRLFLFFKLFLLLKLKNKIRIKIKILEKNFFLVVKNVSSTDLKSYNFL